jgi:hypothetical protein
MLRISKVVAFMSMLSKRLTKVKPAFVPATSSKTQKTRSNEQDFGIPKDRNAFDALASLI